MKLFRGYLIKTEHKAQLCKFLGEVLGEIFYCVFILELVRYKQIIC